MDDNIGKILKIDTIYQDRPCKYIDFILDINNDEDDEDFNNYISLELLLKSKTTCYNSFYSNYKAVEIPSLLTEIYRKAYKKEKG